MNRVIGIMTLTVVTLLGTSCARIETRVVDKPRVDQELQTGNRGYFSGKAPAVPTDRKKTRKYIQTNVELASGGREIAPWPVKKKKKGAVQEKYRQPTPTSNVQGRTTKKEDRPSYRIPVPPRKAGAQEAEPVRVTKEKKLTPSTYLVKRGDTLEKVSDKVYGDANKWRKIYEANRDQLSAPNKIYPGQKLNIPPLRQSNVQSRGDYK